ncbi:hypothetical protein F4677DRAFT_105345 [Hypoxylon crocopeplum]|nr:hypothetical protein F4677DRAFT_105345 [Hypoxylon crocopeplum]
MKIPHLVRSGPMPSAKGKLPASRPGAAAEELFLLSLDGGGVRGLSSLMVLKQLMEAIDPERPPKPCDYFDMIGGTSTGGLIAIMLGRMRLTVDECILAYSELAPEVFTKIHHRISLRNGETQGRFDHVALEKNVKALLKKHIMDSEALLKEPEEGSSCKVFVCATSQQTGRPVVFSTYYNARRGDEWLSKAKIWEAARATSAATTFFDPITIGGETFVDGATGANNPINYLWSEAGDIWGDGGGLDAARVKCLVSIGTGTPALVPFSPDPAGIAKALKAISTDTEVTASMFQKHHSKLFKNGQAFRFNVTSGLESVGLQEVGKWDEIGAATRAYIQEEDTFVKLKKCALELQQRQWTQQLAEGIIEFAQPSIKYLNDVENHIERSDLQWLTHTADYQLWASNSAPSSTLWYRLPPDLQDLSRDSVAASVAQLLPHIFKPHTTLPGSNRALISRSLYFQCLVEPSDGFGDHQVEQHTIATRQVLVSLICQAFLLDHSRFGDITRRILMLSPLERQQFQAAVDNPEALPLSVLSDLLLSVISTGDRPASIAIDNFHLVREPELAGLLSLLRSLFDKYNQTAKQTIPIILSGQALRKGIPELEAASQIDDNTEYNECVRSVHFRDWNTRRDQIDNPDEGTSQWIWKHPEYEAWYADHRGILWIEGKPGSGKSVLARSLQRRIVASWQRKGTDISSDSWQRRYTPKSIVAGWFYSTRLGDIGTSHTSLLRSIIYQLLSQEPHFFDSIIVEYYRKFPVALQSIVRTVSTAEAQKFTSKQGVEQLMPLDHEPEFISWCQSPDFEPMGREILERISATGTSIICIVDAMDEARPDTKAMLNGAGAQRHTRVNTILGALSSLMIGVEGSRMKFVVLSRPEPLLELDFLRAQRKLENTFRITLEHENRADIEVLVNRGIESLQAAIHTYDSESDVDVPCGTKGKTRKPRALQQGLRYLHSSEADALQRIREYIFENARGIILWVTLILKDLQQTASAGMSTFKELESRLRSLPLELDDLYSRIIHDLRSKLTNKELLKSRNIFVLVAGAGSFGRPLSLEELWEALAVPQELKSALESKSDPILSNRVIISSWPDFRRQLVRFCGPLIEVVKPGDDTNAPRSDDVQPGDIIQFIHRTVKDFLEERETADEFSVVEDNARVYVKELASRYLALAFPQENTPYWSGFKPANKDTSEWRNHVAMFVEHLDRRILLGFSVTVLTDQDHSAGQILGKLGFDASVLDQLIHPPAPEWNDSQIRDHFKWETRYYPGVMGQYFSTESVRAVLLGHAAYCACMQGFATATKNLILLYTTPNATKYPYTRDNNHVMSNGALRAAIQHGLLEETLLLTKENRHQGLYIVPRRRALDDDPFLLLASKIGSTEVCDALRQSTTQFTERANGVYQMAVTQIPEVGDTWSDSGEGPRPADAPATHETRELESNLDLGTDNDPEETREAVRLICGLLPDSDEFPTLSAMAGDNISFVCTLPI